jgi:PAS domain S-box-containing protein
MRYDDESGVPGSGAEDGSRLRTRPELHSSETAFRLLVGSVEDYAIFMLDADGRVASWNRGAERINGYSAEEVLGRHFSIFYPPDVAAAGHPERELEAAARDGRYEEEGWRVTKGGGRIWAHVVITALRDEAGGLVGYGKVTHDLTDHRSAALALHDSEARFREIAETIQEVFWIARPDFSEYLYVSPAYEQVWGRPVEVLHEDANAYLEAVHAADRAAVLDHIAQLRGGTQGRVEYRIFRPDGELRWLESRGYPVMDGGDVVVRIIGVTEDVTERKEREEAQQFLGEASRTLASSLDYEETLARVARLAVPRVADWCAVDVFEGGLIRRLAVAHADPAMEQLAREVGERFPPDPEAERGVARVLRTGEVEFIPEVTAEVLRAVARSDEHHRILLELGMRSAMVVPMEAHGEVLGAIVLISADSGRRYEQHDLELAQDLAARAALAVDNAHLFAEMKRRAREEAALRQAAQAVAQSFTVEEVIRRIADAALVAVGGDAAFVERIDAPTGCSVVVAAAGRLAPEPGQRIAFERSLAQQVIEQRREEVVASLHGLGRELPARLVEKCGECAALAVPLLDGGEAIGALIVLRDPSHGGFRPDELARARTFADLAALAFRKVHLLEESEQRREELERVMASRARLLRGFSHDLKNPLGAADGYMQLLEDGVLGDIASEQRRSIGRARRALKSALDLIDDLVDVARAETGQLEIRPEPVDLREVVSEMTEEYRAQAEGKGLQVQCSAPDRFPLIVSDTARIRQVLGNLISNAVKYTVQGRVTVTTGLRPGPESLWCAVVEVADTGPGIPEDRRHLLFREFARLDPKAAAGAGLGLAISRRIAQALGGELTHESRDGGGSTFVLWLPQQTVAGNARGDRQ